MKLVLSDAIVEDFDGMDLLKKIEKAGRTCYKSEEAITNESCVKFVAGIIKSGHESVIEHEKITVRVICDRGVSHEIVRHRIASYSQESTRYCSYNKDKFGGELNIIDCSSFIDSDKAISIWLNAMMDSEKAYMKLIGLGVSAQIARNVLPNSLKTEIVMTMNLREWRHFLKLRTSNKAHPQIREIALNILKDFQKKIPVVFDDINK